MEKVNEVKKAKVRTRFDTSELYHVWANQGQESGESKGCALKFEGKWLKYMGTLIAWVDGEKRVALINGERYTGSGWGGAPENNHRYAAKRAVTGLYKEVVEVPVQFLRWVNDRNCKPGGYGREYGVAYTAEDWYAWALGRMLKVRVGMDKKVKTAKARRHTYMTWGLSHERETYGNVLAALYAMGLIDSRMVEVYRDVEVATEYTQEERDEAQRWSEKWEKVDAERVKNHGAFGRKSWQRRQREREEREKERLIKFAVTEEKWEELCKEREGAVKEWKERTDSKVKLPECRINYYYGAGGVNGRYVVAPGVAAEKKDWREFPELEHDKFTLLAVRDSEGTPSNHEPYVLTSRGARVPIGQAVRLLRLVEAVRMRGEDYKVESGDGGKHQFGYYTLSSVSKDGDVRIGCHEIKWQVIEEFRPRLMEYWLRWKENGKGEEVKEV